MPHHTLSILDMIYKILVLACALMTGCVSKEMYLKGVEHGQCIAAMEWRDYLESKYKDKYVSPMVNGGGTTMDHIISYKYRDYRERCEEIEEHLNKLKWKSGAQLLKENPLPKKKKKQKKPE